MLDSYNNITNFFSFEELYEGKVVKVNDDNSCYVNVYKFFITNKDVNDVYDSNIVVSTSNIENLSGNLTLTKSNSILCKPMVNNANCRKVNPNDNVLVMFLNGDPQRPYYIDAYLPSVTTPINGDIIFKNNNIEISTVIDEEDPKIIFKIKDSVFVFDKDTKFGTGDGTGDGSGDGTNAEIQENITVIQGSLSDLDWDLLRKLLALNGLKREFEDLKDKYSVAMGVADYFKVTDEDRKDIVEAYEQLVALMDPIIENLEVNADEIDIEEVNKIFFNYSKQYNQLIGFFLKHKGMGGDLVQPLPEITDENLESTIRDMIYIVNTKTSKKFLKDIIEDGIFSVEEKKLLANEIIMINNEKQILEILAPLHYDNENSVERLHTLYEEQYDILTEYISPMMVAHYEDTEIGKEEFFNKFMDYFTQRLTLYNELYDYSIKIYDDKKDIFNSYSNDSKLTLEEKKSILNFLKIYQNEKTPFEGLCRLYNVNIKTYTSVFGILEMEIGKMNNTTEDQMIDKEDFMKNFHLFVESRNKLLETIIAISSAYIETLIEGIHIGGVNLIYNSSFLYEFREWSYPNYNEIYIDQILDDDIYEKFLYTDAPKVKATLTPTFIKCKKDDYLVLNFYLRSPERAKLLLTINDSEGNPLSLPYTVEAAPSLDFLNYIVPFTIIKEPSKINLKNKPSLLIENVDGNSSIDITRLKLEFGTNPSEWSPAPEDQKYLEEKFQSIIHEMSSSITQTIDQIKLSVDRFYSKVTESFEEIRKENASVTVEIGNIELSLSDIYQRSEQIVEHLGGLEVITDIFTVHDKISKLQMDYEGMHLSVRDLLTEITQTSSRLDGILQEGGLIESVKGSILDYNNDLKGMGGILTKLSMEMQMQTNYIDGVKESISKIEHLEEQTLIMEGNFEKIENSLTSISSTNILDLEFDSEGNIVKSNFVDDYRKQYAGITTRIDSVETQARETQTELEKYMEKIGDLNFEDSTLSILERISSLLVDINGITADVGRLQGTIHNLETLEPTDFLNNFTFTHTLDKWSPVGELTYDNEGNLEVSSCLNRLCLEKKTDEWYSGIMATNLTSKQPLRVVSDIFRVEADEMYKFSIFIKDHPSNTRGEWRIGVRLYDKSKLRINGYLNVSKTLTDQLWFQKNDGINKISRNYSMYVYPYNSDIKDINLLVRGNCTNAVRMNEDSYYMDFIIEYWTDRYEPILYIDNPEAFIVRSQQVEQLKLLQNADLAIQPDNIMMTVKNHKIYQDDLEALGKYTDTKFEIADGKIEGIIQDSITYDDGGNEIKLKDAISINRQNISNNLTLIGEVQRDVSSIIGNINVMAGLNIIGSNVFKVDNDGIITPDSITLYAYVKDALGAVDESQNNTRVVWRIDNEIIEFNISDDTKMLTIPSLYVVNKDSIRIKATSEDGTMFDECSIVKLSDGEDSITMILSNEFIGIPCNSDATIMDYSQAYTVIDIYEGVHKRTEYWDIEIENKMNETGLEHSYNRDKRLLTIDKLTKDAANIRIIGRRTKAGHKIEVSKTLQVVKIKKGDTGEAGSSGWTIHLSNEAQSIPVKTTMHPYNSETYWTDVQLFYGPYEILDFDIDPIPSQYNISVYVNNNTVPKTVSFVTNESSPILNKEGTFTIGITTQDPYSGKAVRLSKDFSWTCSIQGDSASMVTLTPDTKIFKSEDGGETYFPDEITISATYQNCKFSRWEISNNAENVEFVPLDSTNYTGISATTSGIRILWNSNAFPNDVGSIAIRVITDVDDLTDTVTISKLYDRSDINEIAEKAYASYSYIDQNKHRIENAVQNLEFEQFKTDLNKDLDKLEQGIDRWGYEVFNDFRKGEDPAIEAIIGKAPTVSNVINDAPSITITGYSGKLIRFFTSIKATENITINTKIRMFNKGTIFINSMRIYYAENNATSDLLSLNFSRGWNTIEIFTLAGSSGGFLLSELRDTLGTIYKISDSSKIEVFNAYGVTNDYTNSKFTFSNVEQRMDSITSTVGEIDGKISDIRSTITQTKEDWTAKFEGGGYQNYLDNGDFASGDINPWTEAQYSLSVDGKHIKFMNNEWTGYENALEVYCKNLKSGDYGAHTTVTGLTPGKQYVFCAYVAGHRSSKTISIANTSWNWYNSWSHKGDITGGSNIKNWTKVAIPFVPSENSVYIDFRLYAYQRPSNGEYGWMKACGVYEGDSWKPYIRSGSEAYNSTVKLDMNGITVNHSLSSTYTNLNSTGLTIFKNDNTPLAYFGNNNEAYIGYLKCEKLEAKNVATTTEGLLSTYYVSPSGSGNRSGSDINNAIAGIQACISIIKGYKEICYINKCINIYVSAGDYYETVNISNINDGDNGEIILNLAKNVIIHHGIIISGNAISVSVLGDGYGNINCSNPHDRPLIKNSADVIKVFRNSKYVILKGMCIVGENKTNQAGLWFKNSNLYISVLDFSLCQSAIYGDTGIIFCHAYRGYINGYGIILNQGCIMYRSFSCEVSTKGSKLNGCATYYNLADSTNNVTTVTAWDSQHNPGKTEPPAPTTKTVTQYFSPTSYWSTRTYTDQGEYKQGAWNEGYTYGWWTGQASFGSQVKSFCSGASNITMQIYMERLNTSHGYSDAVNVYLNGHNIGTLTRGQGKWFDVPSSVVTHLAGGGSIWSYYEGTRHYIRYKTNISLWISCKKKV